MIAALLDVVGLGVLGNIRDLGDGALAEESVDQRLRLRREQAHAENLRLARDPVIETQARRRFHRIDGRQRSHLPPPRLARLLASEREDRRVPGRILQFLVTLASLQHQPARDAARELDGALQQVALDDLVENPGRKRCFRINGLAERAHLHGFGDAGQPRQPLRPARSGNDPELHFRLPHLRGRDRHPVMTGHRGFQAAAERGAVDRHHYGLFRIFDLRHHRRQRHTPVTGGGHFSEFANIGAGDEGSSAADHHDRLDLRVLVRCFDPGHDAVRHSGAQRVHRRIIDRDDANLALARIVNQFAHKLLSYRGTSEAALAARSREARPRSIVILDTDGGRLRLRRQSEFG